ncbi:GAF and ANTAR domain-containing protein [Streptomyces sp. Je 1-369]|uniref:GAF and ANTAR domain-containing protein n=1 Tax=Streptomyces sp. Je 1-369 TaxID=2966192 RepID=UPI002285D4E7|nr:GAF and ANTAR domain-containing protein [Streptomyces sp. Je 1-369]WAL95681.1 GAF and ANTAR domain-containing protein [Streptomyces sp. Je 1-369]
MRDRDSELRLADVLVKTTDTLTDDFDLDRYLEWLADRCTELVDARGVGVMYTGGDDAVRIVPCGRQRAVVRGLLEIQYLGGPCVESFGSGQPVPPTRICPEGAGARWPRFAERAGEQGVEETYAVPIRRGGTVLGVLNIFLAAAGGRGGVPSELGLRIAQTLANAAATGLHNHRTHSAYRVLSEQLQTALDSRIHVEQAKGVLAERWQTGMDEAFEALRGYARREQQVIDLVATQVVRGKIDEEELRRGRSAPS